MTPGEIPVCGTCGSPCHRTSEHRVVEGRPCTEAAGELVLRLLDLERERAVTAAPWRLRLERRWLAAVRRYARLGLHGKVRFAAIYEALQARGVADAPHVTTVIPPERKDASTFRLASSREVLGMTTASSQTTGAPGRAGEHRRRLGAILIALAVLAVACSDDPNRADQEAAPSTSREESSTTDGSTAVGMGAARQLLAAATEAAGAAGQEVIDGYLAAEDAFVEAASGPDTDYALEETHTGPMLNQTRAIVEGLAADGLVVTFPPDSQASETVTDVEFRSDDVAIVSACVVDDGMRVDQETGEVVVGGEGPVTAEVNAAMELHDGTWKMAERQITGREAGVAC